MRPGSTSVGSLARELREANTELRAVERRVDEFLESLFLGWRARFPTSVGWRFTDPSTIDVFSVIPSPAAVSALRLAGFLVVTLHEHDALPTCSCPPEPDPKPEPVNEP